MFVSSGQIGVFISCVAFGILSGLIFSFLQIFIRKVNETIRAIVFSIAFIFVGILYVLYSFLLGYPNFRVYMFLGIVLGWILYMESFYIILAKLTKKIYNIIDKKHTKRKTELKD